MAKKAKWPCLPPPQIKYHLQAREDKDGGSGDTLLYAPVTAYLQHDGVYESKVATWAGIGHLVPIERRRNA